MQKSLLHHTPGEWLIGPNDRDNGLSIVSANPRQHSIAICYGLGRLDNAHLIAAAPDMFAALEKIEQNLMTCLRPGDALAGSLATARDAMAKAKPV